MRRILCAVGVFCMILAVVRSTWADDQADARAIVAKAIKAIGGEEKLEKHKAATWKETGMYYGMGEGLPYTGNYAVQWPHQFRIEIVGIFVIVLNGDKGWISMNGETREITGDELAQQQEDHFAAWVTTLTPLKDKMFKLATTGETKVADRTALGVRVSADKHRDVNLFFDKESGLLVKAEYRTIASELGGKEVTEEVFVSDYKEIDGAKVPMKTVVKRDGERYVEAETQEMKAVGKLDDSVFGKP